MCIFRSDKLSLSFFHSFHCKAGSARREGGKEGAVPSRLLPLRRRVPKRLRGQDWDEGKRGEAERWSGTTWDLWKVEKQRGERGKERGEIKQVQEKGLRTLEQEES